MKEEIETEVSHSTSVLSLALSLNIPMTHRCGAEMRCTTCKIRVLSGMQSLSDSSDGEKRVLKQHQFPDFIRLGCQARIDPASTELLEVSTIIKQHGKSFVPKVPARYRKA